MVSPSKDCICSNNSDVPQYESPNHDIPCNEGWFLFGAKCYRIFGQREGLNWKQASVNCSLINGHLATIQSKELQEFLTTFLLLNAETNVWIGLNDREIKSNYTWDDGSNVNFTNWDQQELSNLHNGTVDANCVEMRFTDAVDEIGEWKSALCDKNLSYICQVEQNKDEKSSAPDPRFCSKKEGGGWKYQNSCYNIVTTGKSWKDAETHCQETFNGYLVTILNNRTDIFLDYILPDSITKFWIGIKMQNQTIQRWTSDLEVSYNEWDHEQKVFLPDTCGLRSKQKQWTVMPCSTKLPFICERKEIVQNVTETTNVTSTNSTSSIVQNVTETTKLTSTDSTSSSGSSTLSIVGIVLGSLLFCFLTIVIIYFSVHFCRKFRVVSRAQIAVNHCYSELILNSEDGL